jgi:hypothetical protein
MTELVLAALGVFTSGAGLWLHDWRCLVGGLACIYAAWLLHDVDSCVTRSQERGETLEATTRAERSA